jgi:hypothetical protein
MAYWVEKNGLNFLKYFNSLDKGTRIISRFVAFFIMFAIISFIKIYYYKVSWFEYHKFGSYTNTGHSWEQLFANLELLLIDSFIIAAIIFIVVHTLDYFTKDKNPTLICTTCFKIKDFDNDLKCQCGGRFSREKDMDFYVNEEEFKVRNPSTNSIDRIFIKGTNYYKCLSELPEIIFCPGCLSEIKLHITQQKERKYYCNKCRKGYDFNTPKEWTENGNVKDEFKYGLGFILNGKLNITRADKHRVQNKFELMESYKGLQVLPNEIECPHCQKKIHLDLQEIMGRKFVCSNCSEIIDLTFIQKKE